ncbi:MAG: hypothetical protein HXX08_12700 [Chloroflexi bacterium]|uniref:Uncharacterized protein n=1 Tax=Candidatus Chlorohelix allophototropha TaxID=3003348 RepID=A0A8T7M3S1_9CHLR|nr:hypothetical protein [Chloroflexota bacterium]WJW66102.1 hypothetical protein OZ401_001886 [Chloroflexota bacterium L227-S17]
MSRIVGTALLLGLLFAAVLSLVLLGVQWARYADANPAPKKAVIYTPSSSVAGYTLVDSRIAYNWSIN